MNEILIRGKKYIQVNREAKLGDLVLAKTSGVVIDKDTVYEVNFMDEQEGLGHQGAEELEFSYPTFYLYDCNRTSKDFTVFALKDKELSERKKMIKKHSKKIERYRKKIKKLENKILEASHDISEKDKELLELKPTKINYTDVLFINYKGHEYERVNSYAKGGDLVVFTENNTDWRYSLCNKPYKVIEKRDELVFIGESGDEFMVYSTSHNRTKENTIVFRKVQTI